MTHRARTLLAGFLLGAGLVVLIPQAALATGEGCSLFSPCQHSHDYCRFVSIFSSICTERGDGREGCTGLGQGTCKNGLACDIQGECRNQPSRAGERCGLGVPCASGLNCSTAIGGRCEAPDGPGEACFGIGQGTCANGLVCDFIGECRYDPPRLGQPCGLGVPCAAPYGCSAEIGGRCEERAGPGEVCSGVGQGSCQSGLVCDFLRECRHPTPELDERCGIGAACAEGLFCQAGTQRCKELKTVGQGCSAFNPCRSGLSCDPCLIEGCNYPLQCFPNANDGALSEQACRELYSPALHQAARDTGLTMNYGSGNGASAGVAESQEFGVAYGPDQYGCYTTLCVGANVDLELTAGFVTTGFHDQFASVGGSSTAFVQEVEIAGVLSFSSSQIFERRSVNPFDIGRLVGSANSASLGISPFLLPFSAGVYACETVIDTVVGTPPVCGDGRVEGREACDDGNMTTGDGCSSICTVESLCGNGRRDAGEECDDGDVVSGDGCDASCAIEPACGDGNLDPGEACDDGNTMSGDGCSAICIVEPVCGNGVLEPGEPCDDGNVSGGDGCSAICEEEDADGDGIHDFVDTCRLVPNPGQEDVDAGRDDDGSRPGTQHYGNACDADINQDGIVNVRDLAILKSAFFTTDPVADLNGDGVVNVSDLTILKSRFLKKPGPGAGDF
jgi:cysteine-rich repeat protein